MHLVEFDYQGSRSQPAIGLRQTPKPRVSSLLPLIYFYVVVETTARWWSSIETKPCEILSDTYD